MGAIANRASVILLLGAGLGAIAVHNIGMVRLESPVPTTLSSTASTEALKVGAVMPKGHEHAGWIYGGISKSTGKPFYIAPRDSGVMQWREAMDFAARIHASLPSPDELHQIYEVRSEGALKRTFDTTGSGAGGWYWSSSQRDNFSARTQRFSDGHQSGYVHYGISSVRLVRG